jgi:hypothetical protein
VLSSGASPNATEQVSFPLFLIILAALALIGLPIVGTRGKIAARQVHLLVLSSAGVALLLEGLFLLIALSAFPQERGSHSSYAIIMETTTTTVTVGPAFGFWLGMLATLAAFGVCLSFEHFKKQPHRGDSLLPSDGV